MGSSEIESQRAGYIQKAQNSVQIEVFCKPAMKSPVLWKKTNTFTRSETQRISMGVPRHTGVMQRIRWCAAGVRRKVNNKRQNELRNNNSLR
jgi:hypothetical protein